MSDGDVMSVADLLARADAKDPSLAASLREIVREVQVDSLPTPGGKSEDGGMKSAAESLRSLMNIPYVDSNSIVAPDLPQGAVKSHFRLLQTQLMSASGGFARTGMVKVVWIRASIGM